jgi:hypothetical protein
MPQSFAARGRVRACDRTWILVLGATGKVRRCTLSLVGMFGEVGHYDASRDGLDFVDMHFQLHATM